ncbi:hypothetical protein [Caldivirga sp.]
MGMGPSRWVWVGVVVVVVIVAAVAGIVATHKPTTTPSITPTAIGG